MDEQRKYALLFAATILAAAVSERENERAETRLPRALCRATRSYSREELVDYILGRKHSDDSNEEN